MEKENLNLEEKKDLKPEKNKYIRPEIETIAITEDVLMETWSIAVDNDPNHAIGPGDEEDIGAKRNFFDVGWEDYPGQETLWED